MVVDISPGIEINRLMDIALKAANVRPGIITSQLIKNVDDHHAQLIDKMRYGNMPLRGDTLYVLDLQPAGYVYYAANEAEKASHINITNVQGYGSYGCISTAGPEAEVMVSQEIVESRLKSLSGRDASGKKNNENNE